LDFKSTSRKDDIISLGYLLFYLLNDMILPLYDPDYKDDFNDKEIDKDVENKFERILTFKNTFTLEVLAQNTHLKDNIDHHKKE